MLSQLQHLLDDHLSLLIGLLALAQCHVLSLTVLRHAMVFLTNMLSSNHPCRMKSFVGWLRSVLGGTYEGIEYHGCLDTSEGGFVYDNRGDVLPGLDGPDNLIASTQQRLGQQALAA